MVVTKKREVTPLLNGMNTTLFHCPNNWGSERFGSSKYNNIRIGQYRAIRGEVTHYAR